MVEVVKSTVSTSHFVVQLVWEGAGYVQVWQPDNYSGLT